MYKLFTLSLVYFSMNSLFLHAQVNGYAKVNSINDKSLFIGRVNESHGTFTVGSYIIIMQMQDNAVFPISNDESFGNPVSVGQAGKYEVAQIASIKRTGSNNTVLKDVVLTQPLENSYFTDGNTSVQIITYPTLGNPHYTTTKSLSPLAWDGEIGGVLAFKVNGNLYLNHSITADGAGFRGGSVSTNNSGDCTSSPYRTNNTIYGFKGETIYGVSNGTYQHGRGRIIGGGGGGNTHNAGGGGGSNYSAGGEGGPGFNQGTDCNNTNKAGGLGGAPLERFITYNTLFMGSGGGGGQQSEGFSSRGANGGGILMITADTVFVGPNRTVSLSSNGANATNSGRDGAGGGGAGGSLLLQVSDYVVSSTSTLNIEASGGSGGNVNHADNHGGGGGGGMGVVYTSVIKPNERNIFFSTNAGTAGCNNNSYLRGNCNSLASTGDGGTINEQRGVLTYSSQSALPITLRYFSASSKAQHVELEWLTDQEKNNDYFTLYRSSDGISWRSIAQVKGAGDSNAPIKYTFKDYSVSEGRYFYHLKQTDFDGKYSYSNILSVKINASFKEKLFTHYPNPSQGEFYIQLSEAIASDFQFMLFNSTGQLVRTQIEKTNDLLYKITVTDALPGMYYLRMLNNGEFSTEKIAIN